MNRFVLFFLLLAFPLSALHPKLFPYVNDGILKLKIRSAQAFDSQNTEKVIYRKQTKNKVVALSFDDGPDPRYTLPILKILNEKGARATFYVVGSEAQKYPDIIRDIASQGHEVSNHTWSHPEMDQTPSGQVMSEVKATNLLIEKLTGRQNIYFRPPKGILPSHTKERLEQAGFITVLWTIGIENSKTNTPREMAERVLENIGPGSILLLHDGRLDRSKTVQAFPLLLEGLEQKGYRATTVEDLLKNN